MYGLALGVGLGLKGPGLDLGLEGPGLGLEGPGLVNIPGIHWAKCVFAMAYAIPPL